jgi:hypothetical protein
MRLITLLNHCQHFPGFVYEKARLCPESSTIEIHVRPRRGSKPVCSGCHKPAAGYDQLSIRRFEFVPFWGFMVLLLYRMRRVDCRACGVRVEELPWAIGKHQLTKAYIERTDPFRSAVPIDPDQWFRLIPIADSGRSRSVCGEV